MTHRQIVQALSGLMLAMFVAVLSSTVVATSLPAVEADLGGGQSTLTWVISGTLLALTVSTPLWGRAADLYDRKRLVQAGLSVYVLGSMLGGLAPSPEWLIACRVLQGLGVGGLVALTQVILSDLVSPRERGRYAGYLGAVFGLGTVAGPLLGGVITDTLGWRWCFYVNVAPAAVALVLLQRTLDLPRRRRPGRLLPLLPLGLLRDRTVVLAVVASAGVGVSLFASTVLIPQYMQLVRGYSPTASGLLTIPLVAGLVAASTLGGRRVTRTGRYKALMVRGAVALTAGLALLGVMDATTSLVELGAFMALVGGGLGLLMQNLVLVVQNAAPAGDVGSASALIAFVRTLCGGAAVALLGAFDAYGTAFLAAAPAGLAVVVALALLPERPLGRRSGIDIARAEAA